MNRRRFLKAAAGIAIGATALPAAVKEEPPKVKVTCSWCKKDKWIEYKNLAPVYYKSGWEAHRISLFICKECIDRRPIWSSTWK